MEPGGWEDGLPRGRPPPSYRSPYVPPYRTSAPLRPKREGGRTREHTAGEDEEVAEVRARAVAQLRGVRVEVPASAGRARV